MIFKKSFCFTLLLAFVMTAGAQSLSSISRDIIPGGSDAEFKQRDYFITRPDFRLCVSPMCGGVFVKQVNKKKTRCADGSFQNECYVAKIDWSAMDTNGISTANGEMLLQGSIVSKTFSNFGKLGVFNAKAAYAPVGNKQPGSNSVFVGLENNGIVCITTPCFTTDEHILNTGKVRLISDIDLTGVGATKKQLNAAYTLMAQGDVLFAAGINRQEQEFAGPGLTFIAERFYLPVGKTISKCPKGYEMNGGQCVTPYGCVAPEIELKAYGGAAIVDPVTGEVTGMVSTSCVSSCNPPAELSAPAFCSIFYP